MGCELIGVNVAIVGLNLYGGGDMVGDVCGDCCVEWRWDSCIS